MGDRRQTTALRITTAARLHLGFVDLNGEIGRRYGSIGLAVSEPHTEVLVRRRHGQGEDRASGSESVRALTVLRQLRQAGIIDGAFDVEVVDAIPPHAGLGSGTQLALAVAAGCLGAGSGSIEADVVGGIAERGRRSAIGIATFERGGFIVDGGRGGLDRPPPVLMRYDFPSAWRVLLALDPSATGVHGDRETAAFAALPPMPRATAAHLAHLVLMRLAPALAEADIAPFGAAISEIQAIVGGHFAAAQGGSPWSNANVGRLMRDIGAAGATGIGQSSWGPTGFAFVAGEAEAQRLYHSFVGQAKALGLELRIVSGRNSGAAVVPVTTE